MTIVDGGRLSNRLHNEIQALIKTKPEETAKRERIELKIVDLVVNRGVVVDVRLMELLKKAKPTDQTMKKIFLEEDFEEECVNG